MNNWAYKLGQFFNGRRGTDHLNVGLLIFAMVFQLIGRFSGLIFLYYIGYALLFYGVFRMLSRNIYAREAENQKFIKFLNKITGGKFGNNVGSSFYAGRSGYGNQNAYGYNSHSNNSTKNKNKKKANKPNASVQYCFYHCPSCKQQIRVPAGQGKVRATCPTCKHKFELNT